VAGARAGVLGVEGYNFAADGVLGAGRFSGCPPGRNAVSAGFFSPAVSLLPGATVAVCRLRTWLAGAAAAGVVEPAEGNDEVTSLFDGTTCTTR
jgi:hypothetical protein